MLDDARIGVGQDHRPAGLALHLLSLGAELVPLVADVGADLARASEPEALLHAALGLHLGHFRRSSVVVIDKAPAGQPFWPGRDAPSRRPGPREEGGDIQNRSEEQTYELQSIMRI